MNERAQRVKRKQRRKEIKERRENKRHRDELIRNASSYSFSRRSENTPEAKRGRKKVKRDRANAYKKIKKLEEELMKKTREADKYRKRYERLNKKNEKITEQNKQYNIIGIFKESKLRGKLKKQLLLHCVVAEQIRRKMKNKKILNAEEKRVLSSVVS
ncbi:hypothetical protein MAR_014701 [Mya arenaria]|uniref:Uncharacterized protein n=1 Tax=Mya arenaria TaxID=6604 RepID=A0ABY7FI63_MYAAR|nr:hypothetical protein MAR_014701 [Mya arenaria]